MGISSSGRLTGVFESKALGIIKSVGWASIVHRVVEGGGVVWEGPLRRFSRCVSRG